MLVLGAVLKLAAIYIYMGFPKYFVLFFLEIFI